MKRSLALVGAVLVFPFAVSGCAVIEGAAKQVKINGSVTERSADGKVTKKEFHTTLDKVPGQLKTASAELRKTTDDLVKVLADVPPPGEVTLTDLGLKQFQGQPDVDFLTHAKDEEGHEVSFKYVQLGVPSYDDFFKQVQVVHAVVYQGLHTMHRLINHTTALLNEKVEGNAELHLAVDKALKLDGQAGADSALVQKLRTEVNLATTLSSLVSQFYTQIMKLVSTGEALITGAPASLTNPKVVAHLELVKKGLGDSITVVKSSVELLGRLVTNFKGFDKAG